MDLVSCDAFAFNELLDNKLMYCRSGLVLHVEEFATAVFVVAMLGRFQPARWHRGHLKTASNQ